ncbi:MAG: DUF3516 domain-containing protein [Deltaproteobacteria bacterium]|nr:DUF3516 domain-containing protein [Deltaproteobacteria bacterium]
MRPPMASPIIVPPAADADSLLEAFVSWSEGEGLTLYDAQEEAILEVFEGNNLVLSTPTGSGKSLVAIAAHLRAFAAGQTSVYTSPIKALVSEKFFALCDVFGAENVGMLTGDGVINSDGLVLCCTAEILSNMALVQGESLDVATVIMDEFHYYSDPDRGAAWQVPLLTMSNSRFLLMSATLGDTRRIEAELEELTGAHTATVSGVERPVPLEFSYSVVSLLETLESLVGSNKAPVYLVNFSQREASEMAQSLTSGQLADKERRNAVRAAIKGFRFDSPYGVKLKAILEHGIGVHHAGLLPKYRRLVERLAQQGLLIVICGTDTLGVGVNVPIRTVLFSRLYKFDGRKSRILTVRDFHQIAGRAGRKGYDDVGWVVCQAPEHVIENKRREAKVDAGLMSKKKLRREQPPRGYVQYDESTFLKLVDGQPEELKPRFVVDHGMLLSMLQQDPTNCGLTGGYGRLLNLIDRSHVGPTTKRRLAEKAEQLLASLVHAGLVIEDEPGAFLDAPLRLAEDIDDDFSVFHTLSLYFLSALEKLDPEAEDYPMRVMGLAEAILENPWPVLKEQERRERGDRIQQMKAEGLDYHERMEALEDVTYPKPDADWIYETFNAWLETHPWLAAEHIRPKSVAGELFLTWATFAEYVRELKLHAVEGVLLRHLSQVYRVLARSVPPGFMTDPLLESISFLRATLAHADSSLVTEWEKMLNPEEVAASDGPPPPPDISRNTRSFKARIRAELHQLVRALARKDYDAAWSCVRGDEWTPADFEKALAPYWEEFDRIRFDHSSRLSDNTLITELRPHVWEVSQRLLDPEGEGAWAVQATVDLTEDTAPEGPLLLVHAVEE